ADHHEGIDAKPGEMFGRREDSLPRAVVAARRQRSHPNAARNETHARIHLQPFLRHRVGRERNHESDGEVLPHVILLAVLEQRGLLSNNARSYTHCPSSPRTRGPIFQRRWLWVPAFAGTTTILELMSRIRNEQMSQHNSRSRSVRRQWNDHPFTRTGPVPWGRSPSLMMPRRLATSA